MEIIRNGLDLVLKNGENTILECSNSFPMIFVGYGKETVDMDRGNFKIEDYVVERYPLAITAINEYLGRYPDSPKKEQCEARLDELQNKLYDQAYLNAMTYLKIGYHQSAVLALKNALDKYPRSPHREELLFRILEANYEYASNSRAARQVDRYLNTLDAYYNLIAEYPESEFRREADRMYNTAKRYLDRRGVDTEQVGEEQEEL